jgi:signal recognition particle subunit SRP19
MADHFYVYPAYLTAGGTRSLGRRVPKALALREVSLDDLLRAARALGHTAVAEPEKHYPRAAHLYQGRIKVTKRTGVGKAGFLRALAAELQKTPPAGRGS